MHRALAVRSAGSFVEVVRRPGVRHAGDGSLVVMSTQSIRIVGDPVLRQRAREVTDIDAALVRLADDMVDTMYAAPGLGLAATQIGVQQRFFVYDVGDETGPHVIVNPVIEESDGEWLYDEGCLSVPGLSWEILRPKTVHLTGVDLDGNEVSVEADELLARLYQHELDHLDGVLLIDRLDEDQQREAKRAVRELMLGASEEQVEDAVLRLR
jgi:peptide deformylase